MNKIFYLLENPSNKKLTPLQSSAQEAALQSDIHKVFDLRGVQSAMDYIIGLLVMTEIVPERDGFAREHFRKKAYTAYIANRNNNSRYWQLVGELQHVTNRTPYSVWNIVYENFSEDDIKGNIIPRVLSFAKHRVQWKNPYRSDHRSVTKAQRKRGYNDKGSRPDPAKGRLRIAKDSPELEYYAPEPAEPFRSEYRPYYLFDRRRWKEKIENPGPQAAILEKGGLLYGQLRPKRKRKKIVTDRKSEIAERDIILYRPQDREPRRPKKEY